jgi:endonuclease/exonuclease/phosphatase family metal-dependent hydrolase
MTISLLQLNINSDNYWEHLVPYLTSHDFDLIHLQELTGKNTIGGMIDSQRDCFEELQKILSDKYNGELVKSQIYASSPDSYMGNGIFYKKSFILKEKNVITLHENKNPFPQDSTNYEIIGRKLLHLTLIIEDKTVSFLNTHFAWAKTPKEEPHQTQQGEILLNYLKNVPHPFILSGDFNLDRQQPTIQKINKLARNLVEENDVINTLDSVNHRAKALFPPGVAIDYIFTSPDIKVNTFSVVEEGLSDHLGLRVEIEI